MGQMRFFVPRRQRVPEGALQRAYLAGIEGIPWRAESEWFEAADGPHAEFVLERSEEESGNLFFPWNIEGRGELTLATASLMEREQPYNLPVELARGLVNRLRNHAADWRAAGLILPPEFDDQLHRASAAFIQAVIAQDRPEQAADRAEEAMVLSLDAGDVLIDQYCQQALAARHQQTGQLPTMLGAVLDWRPLDDDSATALLTASNTAAIDFCWREIEPSAGKFNWEPFDRQVQWCRDHGLRIISGPLLQTTARHLPDWLYLWEDDFEQLQAYIAQFIRATIARYKGKVQIWNCAARMNVRGAMALTEEQRLRLVVTAIEEVRRSDATTPTIISFDRPWAEYMAQDDLDLSPLHFADSLVRAELGVAGVGIEVNLGYWPGGTLPRDLLEINRQLDRWSVLNLPLIVYLTVPSGLAAADSNNASARPPLAGFAGGPSPETQQAQVQRLAPLLLAKPYVQGVIWNQLCDAYADEFALGGLFDTQPSAKPVVSALAAMRREHLM